MGYGLGAFLLAVSLVLYLTGLFAPVRRGSRSADRQAQPQA